MSKHEHKNCGRCEKPFECKVGDISNCECMEIILSNETKDFLSKTKYDCVCKKCLTELNSLVNQSTKSKFPLKHQDLVEGVHYDLEDEKIVYSEFYHIQRGFCCKMGCRNCAYGFKK